MPFKDPEVRRIKHKEYSRRHKEKNPERMRLFYIWCQIRKRCSDPSSKHFKDYGGRGITVCERWMKFELFLNDMGPRPHGYLLERKDNNGGYSPDNCVWATRKEQNSNRRNCIYVPWNTEKVTLREYCRRKEMPYRPVLRRILRGWEIDLAISTPVRKGTRYATVRRNSKIA